MIVIINSNIKYTYIIANLTIKYNYFVSYLSQKLHISLLLLEKLFK